MRNPSNDLGFKYNTMRCATFSTLKVPSTLRMTAIKMVPLFRKMQNIVGGIVDCSNAMTISTTSRHSQRWLKIQQDHHDFEFCEIISTKNKRKLFLWRRIISHGTLQALEES